MYATTCVPHQPLQLQPGKVYFNKTSETVQCHLGDLYFSLQLAEADQLVNALVEAVVAGKTHTGTVAVSS